MLKRESLGKPILLLLAVLCLLLAAASVWDEPVRQHNVGMNHRLAHRTTPFFTNTIIVFLSKESTNVLLNVKKIVQIYCGGVALRICM